MARVVNVADLVQPDIDLVTDAGTFHLPGDPPVALWLQITDAAEAFDAASAEQNSEQLADALRSLERLLIELFQIHQPDLDTLPLGIGGMLATVTALYDSTIGEEADAVPPRKGGTPSTRKRTPRASTSRS